MALALLLGAFSRLALMVLAPTGAPMPAGPGASTAGGTVVFGGDVVPHGDVLASFEAHGPESLFAPLAPVLRAADLAFVNLETPVAPSHPIRRHGMRFNVHEDFVRALLDAGIAGASIANNHSYDLGVEAVGETVATLRAAGLRPIGGALRGEDPLAPQRFDIAGSTLCVFAATRLLNYWMPIPGPSAPRIALARPESSAEQDALLAAVRRHRDLCGAIVVSLHSGVEYQDRPEPADRVYFHRLAAAGADAVIAHHSHTPQPVELYETSGRQVPIFYSLGNLVSNQGSLVDGGAPPGKGPRWQLACEPRVREGLLAVLRFEATPASTRLRLAEFGFVPVWTVNTRFSTPAGQAPTIAAALLPRQGAGDPLLAQRWQGLLARIGTPYVLPEASIPGGTEGYQLSAEAVLSSRRAAEHPARGPDGGAGDD